MSPIVCIQCLHLFFAVCLAASARMMLSYIIDCSNSSDIFQSKSTFVLKSVKDIQYLDFKVVYNKDFGDNTYGNMKIKNEYNITLVSMKEENSCKMLNKYLGQLWSDAQRAAHILVPSCPLKKGVMAAKHFKLDFSRMTLQALPSGRLYATFTVFDTKTKLPIACTNVAVDNI